MNDKHDNRIDPDDFDLRRDFKIAMRTMVLVGRLQRLSGAGLHDECNEVLDMCEKRIEEYAQEHEVEYVIEGHVGLKDIGPHELGHALNGAVIIGDASQGKSEAARDALEGQDLPLVDLGIKKQAN